MFCVSTTPIPTSLASHCRVKGWSKSGHDKIAALTKAFLTFVNACLHSIVHVKRVFFLVKLVGGATMVEKFGTCRRYQLIIPIRRRTSRTPFGCGMSTTALTLAGVVEGVPSPRRGRSCAEIVSGYPAQTSPWCHRVYGRS
jgi:hypothetical protein